MPVMEAIKHEESRTLAALAKRHLIYFCEYAGNGLWQPAKHLALLCRQVEKAIKWSSENRQQHKLIVVSMPPQHGKTQVISRFGPAWFLGKYPDRKVILSSYGADLATELSRDARRAFEEYASPLFGLELSDESQAASNWLIRNRAGGLHSAGVAGPITGRGASLAIVDDPIKNMEDAMSLQKMEKLLIWFKTTLLTRMAPGGAIIIVATRWGSNDLIGMLLKEAKTSGMEWEVINLPAIATKEDVLGREPGEALWPGQYSREMLDQIKATMASERLWNCLYQGMPSEDVKGALWRFGLIEGLRVHEIPELYQTVVSWDPAVTSTTKSAEHGILVLSTGQPYYKGEALGHRQHGYVLEDLSDVYTPDKATEVVYNALTRHDASKIIYEGNQGGDWIKSMIETKYPEMRYNRIKKITAQESKRARAENVESLYEQKKVHHVNEFLELEKEMTQWTGPPMPSPNRLDALVHGFAYLFGLTDKGKKEAGVF